MKIRRDFQTYGCIVTIFAQVENSGIPVYFQVILQIEGIALFIPHLSVELEYIVAFPVPVVA